MKKVIVSRNKVIFYSILCLLFTCSIAISQDNTNTNIEINPNILENPTDIRREEIQRYFGYETLFFRYLTIPYDAVMNTNQQGKFVDIGFLMLSILPIIFLGLLIKRKYWFYSFAGICIAYISICFSYSLVMNGYNVYSFQNGNWDQLNTLSNKSVFTSYLEIFYSISYNLTFPIRTLINNLSVESDNFTYAVLCIIFLSILVAAVYSKSKNNILLLLGIIFSSYGFMWLFLAGGIIWYGFLFIPLGLLLIGNYQKIDLTNHKIKKYFRYMVHTGLIVWLLLSFVLRISNIDVSVKNNSEHFGKTILNGSIFPFSVGLFDEDQTLDFSTPNLSKALNRINSNTSLIYMIGTSYSFNIKNNVKRIMYDQALDQFRWLVQSFEEKDIIIDALKTSGFKYIIVDLHTPSLDSTPEKSLTQKFQLLLNTLYQNPAVSLIATDRIVEFTDSSGQPQQLANVFGQKLITHGSYAIYEIL